MIDDVMIAFRTYDDALTAKGLFAAHGFACHIDDYDDDEGADGSGADLHIAHRPNGSRDVQLAFALCELAVTKLEIVDCDDYVKGLLA